MQQREPGGTSEASGGTWPREHGAQVERRGQRWRFCYAAKEMVRIGPAAPRKGILRCRTVLWKAMEVQNIQLLRFSACLEPV
jgi:hypothetical protein